MQIFIGRIPRDIRYDELYDYFNRFGKIRELRLLDSYGFVTFVYDMDARRVLDEKHFLFGKEICVEPSRDSRPGSSYSVNRFERDYPKGFDRGYRSPPSYDRGYCDYCDRCEIHGTRRYRFDFRRGDDKRVKLGDFNGVKTKLVIDNLSPATNKQDLIDFLISKGFEPIYTRITEVGNHGIVEFRSVEEKEDALLKLNNLEFLGNKITVRPYFSRESRGNFENESRSYSRKSEESKEYNNNYSENVNKEDIYGDINLNCEDKIEEKNVEEKVENSELNK